MNKILLVILLSSLFIPSICFSYDYTSDANCVGAWLMDIDENPITDSSGEGNTGALQSAGHPDYFTPAKFGGGYSFDGSQDYVSVTDDTTLKPLSDVAIMGYVKFDSMPGNGASYITFSKDDVSSNRQIAADIYNDNGDIYWDFYLWDNLNSLYVTYALDNVVIDTWYHFCGVRNQTTITQYLYVDGVEMKTVENANNLKQAEVDYNIGARVTGGTPYYTPGDFDECAFFDRALTSTEINDIMDNGLVGSVAVARRIMFIN